MREQFIESFGKQEKWKGLFLFFVYFIFNILGENVLTKMGKETLLKNGDFILYLILFLLTVFLFGNQERKAMKAVKDKKRLFTDGLTMLVIISAITMVVMVIAAIVISNLGIRNYNEELIERDYMNHKFDILFTALVFAPVSEEYIYRFFLFRLFRKHQVLVAHLATALLFGFSHVWYYVIVKGDDMTIFALLPTFCIGLGCSVTYEKTKCMVFPILLHSLINLIGCL